MSFLTRLSKSNPFFWIQSGLCLLNVFVFMQTFSLFSFGVAVFCALMAAWNWQRDTKRLSA